MSAKASRGNRKSARTDRQSRLADALRSNLRKRKAGGAPPGQDGAARGEPPSAPDDPPGNQS